MFAGSYTRFHSDARSQIPGPRPQNAWYSVLFLLVFCHEVFLWFVPCSWHNNLSNIRLTVSCCFHGIVFGNCWRVPCSFDYMLSGSWWSVPCCFHTIFYDGFCMRISAFSSCTPSFLPSLDSLPVLYIISFMEGTWSNEENVEEEEEEDVEEEPQEEEKKEEDSMKQTTIRRIRYVKKWGKIPKNPSWKKSNSSWIGEKPKTMPGTPLSIPYYLQVDEDCRGLT